MPCFVVYLTVCMAWHLFPDEGQQLSEQNITINRNVIINADIYMGDPTLSDALLVKATTVVKGPMSLITGVRWAFLYNLLDLLFWLALISLVSVFVFCCVCVCIYLCLFFLSVVCLFVFLFFAVVFETSLPSDV